jgi:hypothetical protein
VAYPEGLLDLAVGIEQDREGNHAPGPGITHDGLYSFVELGKGLGVRRVDRQDDVFVAFVFVIFPTAKR